jgi:hypothetical protein
MKGKEKKRTEDDIGPTIHVGEVNYRDKPEDRKRETECSNQKSRGYSCLVPIVNVVGEVAHGFYSYSCVRFILLRCGSG